MFIVPLSPDPNQRFKCAIPVDGRVLELIFEMRFDEPAGYWTMKLTDALTDAVLLDTIPLISGVYPSANLLSQYSFLGIGSAYMIKINPDNTAVCPDSANLGTDFKLVWGDTVE